MARPREFDTEHVLTDAINVFWQHGCDAVSLPKLLKGMGLKRGSLCKAFSDKTTLFIEVLKKYEVETVDPTVALLSTGPADRTMRNATLFGSVSLPCHTQPTLTGALSTPPK